MDVLVAVGVVLANLGMVAAAAFTRHLVHRRWLILKPWQKAAQAARLDQVGVTGMLHRKRLAGRAGRFTVELTAVRQWKAEHSTRVSISGLPPGLTLRLETRATAAAKGRGVREVEVGDADFDDLVFVEGAAPLVLALMDAGLRARVRSMLWSDVSVERGELTAFVASRYEGGSEDPLITVLPTLLEFAARLVRPADIVDRLAANARQDPVLGVRVQNLAALAREYPEHPLTAECLRRGLSDPSPDVRLCAAASLGEEGRSVLLELAGGESTDDSCAARAIGALGERLPPERTRAILVQALRARRLGTASACLAALGRSRSQAALATLAQVLARESGPLAVAAARALGAYGSPEAEVALIAALGHHAQAARVAAAEALGLAGSAGAVEPLRQAEAHHSGDGNFRRAARQAIAAIKSRAGSASPGQLTLAEGESGRLSLEDDSAGHVSLASAGEGVPRPADRG
jgi:HEAT repeat protein